MKINGMLDSSQVLQDIERIASESGAEYIDVVVDYCFKNGLEIEVVASIIKKSDLVKSKIQEEAEELHILPRTAKLPV